ncbi:EamA-like transporter family protein [Actinomadura rubteroloni]|uniref:EamA-like transporter family protein n=1 Tax=Actinomadura rubteroloni TaxID=1926885 RepID=A0A2P4UHA8_9ACTN|nr:DMT family transporter [Actinomadura rubteroloni]POM24420.1 EamA-like transporter family protein [Actinomadura rubteroloni]
MRNDDSATDDGRIAVTGTGLAALGVLAFSFTFPANVLALDGLPPALIGVGRCAVAALPAGLLLLAVPGPAPRRGDWAGLLVVVGGVLLGYPVLTSLALAHGSSSAHAAVIIGLLPGATAVCALVRGGERPSRAFWLAAAAGAACVTGFALVRGGGGLGGADLLLLAALLVGAAGYAEGGRIARTLGGPRVISWALVLAAPVALPATFAMLAGTGPHWTGRTVAGFAYLAFGSSFLGFFAWYAGMARTGIARAGQVQLVQPLLTLAWSALLLGEHVDALTAGVAVAVLVCVGATQRARIRRAPVPVPAERLDVAA